MDNGARALRVRDYQNLKLMTKNRVDVEPNLFAKKNKRKEKLAAKLAGNGATTIGDVAPDVVNRLHVDTEIVKDVPVKSVVWTKPKRTEEDLIRFNALPKPLERNMNRERFVAQTGLSAFGFSHEQSPLYGGPVKNEKKQKEEEEDHKRARKKSVGAKNSHTLSFDANVGDGSVDVPKHIARNLKISYEMDSGERVKRNPDTEAFDDDEIRPDIGDGHSNGHQPGDGAPPDMAAFMAALPMGNEYANGVANFLEGPLHFWMSILYKLLILTPDQYGLIANDIAVKYACLLRTQHLSMVAAYGGLFAVFFNLRMTLEVSNFVKKARNAELFEKGFKAGQAVEKDGDKSIVIGHQAGEDNSSADFFTMFFKLDKVLSGPSSRSLVKDLLKAVSIAGLAMTAYSAGKFDTFSMESANSLFEYTMRKFTGETSGYAGIINALTGTYNVIYNWFSMPNGTSFIAYIKQMYELESQLNMAKQLTTENALWESLTAEKKHIWSRNFIALSKFCETMLGSNKGWKDARRFMNATDASNFQRMFIALEARYISDVASGTRRAPFAMAIIGGSAIGKTSVSDMLNEYVFQLEEVPLHLKERLCYYKSDNGSEFWDGFEQGTVCLVYDDMCALLASLSESSGGDKMRKQLSEVINNSKMLLDMAHLEQKGKFCMSPAFVQVNSNVSDLKPGELYRFPAIFDRRFDLRVYLKVKEQFATKGYLDKAKVEEFNKSKPIEQIDEPDDFWEWYVYSSEVTNSEANNPGNTIPELTITTASKFECKFEHTLDFLAYFKEAYMKHRVRQFALLNKLKSPKCFERRKPFDGNGDDSRMGPDFIGPRREIKPKVEAYESSTLVMAGAAAMGVAALGYCATNYVYTKCRQVDELIQNSNEAMLRAQRLSDEAAETMRRINATHDNLVGGVSALAVDADVALANTLDSIKKVLAALACVAGLLALLKVGQNVFMRSDVRTTYQGAMMSAPKVETKPPEVHPNDLIARYEPVMGPGFGAYLTKESQANQGYTLFNRVKAATIPITFISTITLEDGTNRTIKSHCFFVRGRIAAFNLHALPTEERGPLWADWTLRLVGCGTNDTDIYMSKSEVLTNLNRYTDKRDLLALYVPKARDFPDLVKYMPDLPGETLEKCIPPGYNVCVPKFGMRLKDGANYYGYTPPEITHMGPVGMTVQSHRLVHDRDDSKLLSVVRMNVVTNVGDCGVPYMGFKNNGKNDNLNVVYGLHMGVNEDDVCEKLVVPIRKQDFEHMEFQFTPEEPKFSLALNRCSLEYDCSSRMKIFRGPIMSETHHMKDPTKTWIANTVAEVNGSTFEPTGSGWFYGQRERFCSATFQTKVMKAPLADILREKDFSHLPFGKFGSNRVQMVLSKKDVSNGVAVALSKGYSQPPYNRRLAQRADFVVDNMIRLVEEDMQANPDSHVLKQLQPVSKEVALNGMCAGEDNGVRLKGLEGVNKQTSSGYPNNEHPTPNGKKGKLGYIIQTPGMPDRVHEDMDKAWEDLRACMATGEYRLLMQAVIKDEAMKPEKLAEGRIRFIIVMPMEGVLLIREHLVTLCRIMALNPFFFGAMVGVDSSSIQWEQIYNFLSANGALIFDGDFKGFEYALFQEITDAIQRYVNKLCQLSGNYDKDQLALVSILLMSMFQVVIDFFGNVHAFRSINSSGNPLTTQFNCIGVNLWAGVALCERLEELMGPYFDPELYYEIWKYLLRMANYGDDLLASMIQSMKYDIQLLNQKIMQEKLAQYGVTFTDSAKNIVVTHEYSEVYTFLGRTFSRDHAGRCVAKLEAARIMKALEFTTEHEVLSYSQLLRSSLRSVLQESYYYGRDAYEGLYDILTTSVAELFKETREIAVREYFSNSSGEELTYDFFESWFSEKYPKGAIVDRRYDEVMTQDRDVCEALYERIAEAMRANGVEPKLR